MSLWKFALIACMLAVSAVGCEDTKAVIPTTELTEEQKAAIKAEDAKVADEESLGAKRR